MKDERKDDFEDGNWVEKSKTQKSLGVIKNIEDFVDGWIEGWMDGWMDAVFRIRIRSDPYHWPGSGSGSVSGNVDLDPGTKKKS